MIGYSTSQTFGLPIGLLSNAENFIIPLFGNAQIGTTRLQINYPIKTTIELSMLETSIGGGLIDWIDNGSFFDEYSSKFDTTVKESTEIDELIQGVYYSEINTLKTDKNSIYPMSPVYDYSGGVDVVLESITYNGKIDIWGKYKKYTFEISNKATPPIATEEHGCDLKEGWILDGLILPFPQSAYQHKNNNTLLGIGHNGSYTDVTTVKRKYGNTTYFNLLCSIKQTRTLINKLRSIRGLTITVQNQEPYFFFGAQYPVTVLCRLSSPKITVSQMNADRCEISFSLMIVGVPE